MSTYFSYPKRFEIIIKVELALANNVTKIFNLVTKSR